MTDPIDYTLNPRLNSRALAERFARAGRASIRNFLDEKTALNMHAMLRNRQDWQQVINSGEKPFELSRQMRAEMDAEQIGALDNAVYAGARSGFQYRYETLRVPDDESARLASDDPLARFAHWFSSGPACELLRRVSGCAGIEFADMQATAYAPGDFLTAHDDAVFGKHRLAAYVLGLTPQWRAEWGGLLLFHDGEEVEGFSPHFNTLNIFRVPQAHSVSEVTRAAASYRYSLTGWLRSRND